MSGDTKEEKKTSSDDSGYYSADGTLHQSIESFVISKDPFRKTAVGIPRPYPMKTHACSSEMAAIAAEHVVPRVSAILETYSLQASRGLYQRSRPDEEPIHSYVVDTTSRDTTNWETLAEKILALFVAAGVAEEEIEVEICNPALLIHNTSHILPDNSEILRALENVRPKILKHITEHLPSLWTSVAYHLRRSKSKPADDGKPTVLLFCYKGAIGAFQTFEKSLLELMRSESVPLALEILPGEIDLNVNEMMITRPSLLNGFRYQPSNGSSITFRGSLSAAGSLGGWLYAKLPSTQRRLKLGMTCYHVATTREEGDTDMDSKPSTTASRGQTTTMEYPARIDYTATIEHCRELIRSPEGLDPRLVAQRQTDLDRLTSKHKAVPRSLGPVLYVSGVRANSNNHRMDWALFETPDTFEANIPPPATSFQGQPAALSDARGPIFYAADADTRVQEFGDIALGDWVCKRGRTTGATSGQVHRMKRDVHWLRYNNFVTQEIEVMGLTGAFADGGDSGAWVFDSRPRLVAALIGKDSNASDYDSGLVTPIKAIAEDFKGEFGGDLSLTP